MTRAADSRPGEFAPGTLLNERYRVSSVLGRGGAAVVYLAEDESLGRKVALKVATSALGETDEAATKRREAEVRLIAGFHHPALVTLYDLVPLDDGSSPHAMLVMQYVDGQTLAARLVSGRLPNELTADIGAAVASALAHVHERGVVHRDIKPANILLPKAPGSGDEVAVLADFGIARLVDEPGVTSTGTIIGTANYLSPEQAAGENIGPASDIYSLGLVLLECATGSTAFTGTALEAVAARLSSDPSIPANLATGWAELLRAMLARDPADRPSAAEVVRALRDLANGQNDAATKVLPRAEAQTTELLVKPSAPQPIQKVAGRSPWRFAWIAVAALAAVVVLLLVVTQLPRIGSPAAAPTSSPSTSTSAPPVAPDYPAVAGALGDRLEQLEQSIASLQSSEATTALQSKALALAELAADEDYEAALGALDDFETAFNGAQLTADERQAIQEAIDAVRHELDRLNRDNGKGQGKGNK